MTKIEKGLKEFADPFTFIKDIVNISSPDFDLVVFSKVKKLWISAYLPYLIDSLTIKRWGAQ